MFEHVALAPSSMLHKTWSDFQQIWQSKNATGATDLKKKLLINCCSNKDMQPVLILTNKNTLSWMD